MVDSSILGSTEANIAADNFYLVCGLECAVT